jgi:hypothetical protein
MVNIEKRMKLKGVLERTASFIEVKGDGSLVVELYDFSDKAEEWFGNDVASCSKFPLLTKAECCLASCRDTMKYLNLLIEISYYSSY